MKNKKFLLGLATIILLVTGCDKKEETEKIDLTQTILTVNEEEISADDFLQTLKLYKIDLEENYGEDIWETKVGDKTYKEDFKETIINQMADIQVIYQDAKENNLLPTEYELKKHIENLEKSIDENEDYKLKLEEEGVDEEFVGRQQRVNLALDKYKLSFDKTQKISEEEIVKYYEENKKEFIINDSENVKPLDEVKETIKLKLLENKYIQLIDKKIKASEIEINKELVEQIQF